ncbi:MAG: phage terminase large subunit [Oscillospiraceae bacterium]|nr:phage terminase large subunit [Oscillospiraceae bacterium]
MGRDTVIWRPQPKQIAFMRRAEDEVFYGGAAGGGKSDALVIEAARQVSIPHYKGLLIRKTYPQLSELIEKSFRYYTRAFPRARYNEQKHTWTFPSGAKIVFGSMQHERDRFNYQGKAFDFIGFDELTHFTRDEYIYLLSRNRPNGPGTRVYTRSTGNPGGIGHTWVKERFVDPGPLKTVWEQVVVVHPDGHSETRWMSRAFVPASVFDNQALLRNDEQYLARLASMPEKEKQALLYGDWDSYEGQFFEDFRVEPDLRAAAAAGVTLSREELKRQRRFCHVIEPFQIPAAWKVYRSFDWGYRRPFSCGWWAVDFEGTVYRILELYGCTETANEGIKWTPEHVFGEIRRLENEHPLLKGRRIQGIADPAIWNAETGVSIAETAARCGVFFEKGDHQRIPGWMQLHYRFAFDEQGFPQIYVFSNCRAFIRTIPLLQFDEHRPEDLDTSGEDHVADETRYFLMSRPIRPRETVTPDKSNRGPMYLYLDIDDLPPQRAAARMEVLPGLRMTGAVSAEEENDGE